MKIYHGALDVVSRPQLSKGRLHNDYGQGFYCTRDLDLACEWACRSATGEGIVNHYELDVSDLRVLDLDENPYGIVGWAATLMKNRPINHFVTAQSAQVEAFIARYACDFSAVDVVEGYRADDSYFDIMRHFVANVLTVGQLDQALRLGGLGRQLVLKSPRAFEAIRFVKAEAVEASVWNPRREARNQKARDEFVASLRKPYGDADELHDPRPEGEASAAYDAQTSSAANRPARETFNIQDAYFFDILKML